MPQKRNEPTWPLLCILVCLFVLSATSPSLWERAARKRVPRTTAGKLQAAAIPPEAMAGAASPVVDADPNRDDAFPPEGHTVQIKANRQEPCPAVGTGAATAIHPAALAGPVKSSSEKPEAKPCLASNVPASEGSRRPGDVEALRALLLPTDPLGDGVHRRRTADKKMADIKIGDAKKPAVAAEKPAAAERPSHPEVNPAINVPTLTAPAGRSTPSRDQPSGSEPGREPVVSGGSAKPPAIRNAANSSSSETWPSPEALYAQLASLAQEPQTRDWASNVEKLVRKFGPAISEGTEAALPLAAKLEQLGEQGGRLAAELGDRPLAARLRRAVYSLDRRLALWKPIARAGGLKADTAEKGDDDLQTLESSLDEVHTLLTDAPEGPGWRRFLELDALRKLTANRGAAQDGQARSLARKVLDRLAQVPMKVEQRRFLGQGPLAALERDLRRLAAEPVPFRELVRHVEQFEQASTPHDARILADDCQRLSYSKAGQKQAIGQGLEGYYRNANVRLVVAVELLNRFIPERPKEYGDVRDVVLGRPVHGSSLTATRVSLRLIPDPQQVHIAFDVNGVVAASTHSVSGPATFYSDSQSVYRGWKEIEIGPEGMHIHSAQVAVNNDLTLRGLSTDFDELPLIGALAQEVARSQHEQKRCQMSSEVEQKIAARARSQIDQEAETRLGTAAQRVRTAVLDPLTELSLGPALVSAETTERRVSMRLRVASDRQLGGHTPRPQAPTDSAVSFQLHESALNNVFEQVGLNGTTLTLPQLRARIANRLKCNDLLRAGTENDDVTIAFAPRGAVQVSCRDAQIILTLAIARLAKPPHAWEDFQVRVFLRPRVQGRTVDLVRDEVIHLMGSRLSMRSQIALRGVFGKTFSKERPIAVIPDRIVNEPRLQDLVFTQWVIEDGWIGAALGPGRVARKSPPPDQAGARTN